MSNSVIQWNNSDWSEEHPNSFVHQHSYDYCCSMRMQTAAGQNRCYRINFPFTAPESMLPDSCNCTSHAQRLSECCRTPVTALPMHSA